MTTYLLVKIDTPDNAFTPEVLQDEVKSNLESVSISIMAHVRVVPKLDEKLTLLHQATQDDTPAMECTAALAVFSADLLKALDLDVPEADGDSDMDGETDLSEFTRKKPN